MTVLATNVVWQIANWQVWAVADSLCLTCASDLLRSRQIVKVVKGKMH
jgi:hypothetical protein